MSVFHQRSYTFLPRISWLTFQKYKFVRHSIQQQQKKALKYENKIL